MVIVHMMLQEGILLVLISLEMKDMHDVLNDRHSGGTFTVMAQNAHAFIR